MELADRVEIKSVSGAVFTFGNAATFTEGDYLVVYSTNPLRELNRYNYTEIASYALHYYGKKRFRSSN